MSPNYFSLSPKEQKEILTSTHVNGLPANVLQKDVWVVWALEQVFKYASDHPSYAMVFKGGTSLSKGFQLIKRFSEDIDVTIDYRAFANVDDPFRSGISKTKQKAISETLVLKTNAFVKNELQNHLVKCLDKTLGKKHHAKIEATNEGEVFVHFPSALESTQNQYVLDRVKLEFGGRNSLEPHGDQMIETYLQRAVPLLSWPQAKVQILSPERTFWEKVTLIHAENQRKEFPIGKDRMSRHWYDLSQLILSPIGKSAMAKTELFVDVVKFKDVFYSQPWAKLSECLKGKTNLLPQGDNIERLSKDYEQMKDAGMFFETPPTFESMLDTLGALEADLKKFRIEA